MSELWIKDKKILTIRDVNGVPGGIKSVDNPELLPISLQKDITWEKLRKWLDKRILPAKREGLDKVNKEFGDQWLNSKNYCSLSDHYWLKMRTENWKRINFFTNTYSPDVGNMFFSPWLVSKRINNFSPDITTGGVLKKRWIQDNATKKSSLVKAGSIITKQEPLSEVLVSVLVEKLDKIKSAGYDFHVEGTTMCSICDNFVTLDTELVTAQEIFFTEPPKDKNDVYNHLLRMCEKFDIPNAETFINWVIFIDTVTGNSDRNLNNIGFLMDVNTRKFIGPAPLYDCGNAYFNTYNLRDERNSKLFRNVENGIFNKLKSQCELDKILSSEDYKNTIALYPCISDEKKDTLIEEINKLNNRLKNEINVSHSER